jgi:hypothetical protein
MKKLAFLSAGILAFALQSASAQYVTNVLFTTSQDWSAFTAAWGNPTPSASSTFSTDASTINGIGNLTAPGAAGTSGSLIVGPGNGWTEIAGGPSQGGNPAFLSAIDPGYANDNNSVAYSGNMYIDYSLPDNNGGTYFNMGVLMTYAANGYWGTFFATSSSALGFQDPLGYEVYRATIPYTIIAGQFNGFGFGVMADTDYNPVDTWYVDNITTVTLVPEPGTMTLLGLGALGFAFLARRRRV